MTVRSIGSCNDTAVADGETVDVGIVARSIAG
jgi:hypothetical protein